jgi:hypothetical protein
LFFPDVLVSQYRLFSVLMIIEGGRQSAAAARAMAGLFSVIDQPGFKDGGKVFKMLPVGDNILCRARGGKSDRSEDGPMLIIRFHASFYSILELR